LTLPFIVVAVVVVVATPAFVVVVVVIITTFLQFFLFPLFDVNERLLLFLYCL